MYFLLFYLKDMFGKKILFLLTGYIAGNAVASVYSGKHKKFKKPESAKDVQSMVEHFLETQKRFVSDVEKKYLSEENKQKLLEKKEDFLKLAEKYTQEGQKVLSEIQTDERFVQGKQKAQGFFSKLKSRWEVLKQEATEDIAMVQKEGSEIIHEVRDEANALKQKAVKTGEQVTQKGKKLLADAKKSTSKKVSVTKKTATNAKKKAEKTVK